MNGWATVIAGFLVTGLMYYFNMGLGAIPGAYDAYVGVALGILIPLFVAWGSHFTIQTLAGKRPSNNPPNQVPQKVAVDRTGNAYLPGENPYSVPGKG